MIAHLSGTIAEKFNNSIIIDVGGVGYEISLTAPDFETAVVGETHKFYTYHHIRENSEELFGFSTLIAKKLFELLTTVQSVGPKAAMSILSLGTPEEVRNAIANTDAAFVSNAAGVGKKTAERIILDLKDKVGAPTVYGRLSSSAEKPNINQSAEDSDEALDALMALGYSLKEATNALAKIDRTLPTADRVRLALQR